MNQPTRTKKRGVRNIDVESLAAIEFRIKQIPKENVRALAAFLYLSGCRVREVLGMKKKIPRGLPQEQKEELLKDGIYIVPPISKTQIDFSEEGAIIIRNVPTFKTKGRPKKPEIPVYYRDLEKPFIEIITAYIDKKHEDEYLWKFSEQYAHRIIYKHTEWMPHFFRSLRATTLRRYYGLDAFDIKKFFNWTDIKQAVLYEQTDISDVKAKMKNKVFEDQKKKEDAEKAKNA